MSQHHLPLRYRVPSGVAEDELVVRNSVFVGTAGHATDATEARAFVDQVRAAYPDANHHAWAYRISPDPQGEMGSSDDGEPGGTAGRPMLAVLDGSGLRQVVVVGTRYFGGTKLGTGGLVRAYSQVARLALARLPAHWCVLHLVSEVVLDYSLYGTARHLLSVCDGRIEEEGFTDQIRLRIAVPACAFPGVAEKFRDISNGRVTLDANLAEKRYYAES